MGRYYDEVERDERKAVKCYQRAVQLDAGGEEHAARRLVDVYAQWVAVTGICLGFDCRLRVLVVSLLHRFHFAL